MAEAAELLTVLWHTGRALSFKEWLGEEPTREDIIEQLRSVGAHKEE